MISLYQSCLLSFFFVSGRRGGFLKTKEREREIKKLCRINTAVNLIKKILCHISKNNNNNNRKTNKSKIN